MLTRCLSRACADIAKCQAIGSRWLINTRELGAGAEYALVNSIYSSHKELRIATCVFKFGTAIALSLRGAVIKSDTPLSRLVTRP